MRRLVALFSFVCVTASPAAVLAPGQTLFPRGLPDPRDVRTRIALGEAGRWWAQVGMAYSLVGGEENDWVLGLEGGGLFVMRQVGSRFPLEIVDGTVGLFAELARGDWRYQFRFTHLSAHFADGAPPGSAQVPFSRETLSARAAYRSGPWILYGGLHYLVNTVPSLPRFAAQIGGTYQWGTGPVRPLAGIDLGVRGETSFNPSVTLQAGAAFGDAGPFEREFRFFYQYYRGQDLRGQYATRLLDSHWIVFEVPL
jgi:hypothetical protein